MYPLSCELKCPIVIVDSVYQHSTRTCCRELSLIGNTNRCSLHQDTNNNELGNDLEYSTSINTNQEIDYGNIKNEMLQKAKQYYGGLFERISTLENIITEQKKHLTAKTEATQNDDRTELLQQLQEELYDCRNRLTNSNDEIQQARKVIQNYKTREVNNTDRATLLEQSRQLLNERDYAEEEHRRIREELMNARTVIDEKNMEIKNRENLIMSQRNELKNDNDSFASFLSTMKKDHKAQVRKLTMERNAAISAAGLSQDILDEDNVHYESMDQYSDDEEEEDDEDY